MENNWKELSEIMNYIIETKIYSEMELIYSNYKTTEDLKNDLTQILELLKKYEIRAVEKIKLLSAPTGSMQEISILNHWSDEYLAIAKKVDSLIETI